MSKDPRTGPGLVTLTIFRANPAQFGYPGSTKEDGSCFARWPTLVAMRPRRRWGTQFWWCCENWRPLFPTFPPLSTPICTTPAPCPSPLSGLPSNGAVLLTSKPANFALFRENPQQKSPFFAVSGHLLPVNTGIRTGNTICCALYLTHPIGGVTFTTATPRTFRRI